MNLKRATPWLLVVALGYILLIGVIFYYLPSPWSWVVAVLVVVKAVIFLWALSRASTIGTKGRPPANSQ